MNTSYGVGEAFANALEGGSTAAEAVSEEIDTLQNIYIYIKTQLKLKASLWIMRATLLLM